MWVRLRHSVPVRETDISRSRSRDRVTERRVIFRAKPHPDSEVEFWHVGNLTACGTSPSQGEV